MRGHPDGQGIWETIAFGAPRGEPMCNFDLHATIVPATATPGRRLLPAPKLEVGFVQNIMTGNRAAIYSRPSGAPIYTPEVFRVTRDGSAIPGTGLLDCGDRKIPWFQGESADVLGPRHASVAAYDNPRWSIPIEFSTLTSGTGTLKEATIHDAFRLFVVAWDGTNYHPIAMVDWGTEITFQAAPGPRPAHQLPLGSLTGRLVWAGTWSAPGGHRPVTGGTRVNTALIDQFIGRNAAGI
jgi:hypothetical protein